MGRYKWLVSSSALRKKVQVVRPLWWKENKTDREEQSCEIKLDTRIHH